MTNQMSNSGEMNAMQMPVQNYGAEMMLPMNQLAYSTYSQIPYQSYQHALNLMRESVKNEKEDELFYSYLISVAPSKEDQRIIRRIRKDERKHNKMFRSMYQALTGQVIEIPEDVDFKKPTSYIEGVKQAFFGELAAMERYRDIRAGLPIQYFRDMTFEILTDEMKHADLYNYILNLDLRRKLGM